MNKRGKKAVLTPESERASRGRKRDDASFPVAPARRGLPDGYAAVLAQIKQRIQTERLRVIMAANSAMVLLYWDIGRLILDRQEREGWGAKVIDRLSADLREAYPDMSGLSPRNLKYMRAFAAAWPDVSIVQETLARIPWYHHIALLERCRSQKERLWYALQSASQGWSHNVLKVHIASRLRERQGRPSTTSPSLFRPPTQTWQRRHSRTRTSSTSSARQIRVANAKSNRH